MPENFLRPVYHQSFMDRKIPTTMATQHPDNASAPYWKSNGEAFISTLDELEECFRSYTDIGCQEYMWDWEGKYVDEGVVDKLFSSYHEYFQKYQLGKDVFLTFRLPNIWYEKGYRIARAYIGILTFADLARDLGLNSPPVFEVILPMTDEAQKMLHLKTTFQKIARLKNQVFDEVPLEQETDSSYLQVIPLIEGVPQLTASHNILMEYARIHEQAYGEKPPYIRPFIARSDPALNAGFIPATIAAKVALSEYYKFGKESGIGIYPIMGVGSLPFRGGLSPNTVPQFAEEYAGVRTVTLQSAFRYDYPLEKVREAVHLLNRTLPFTTPLSYSEKEIREGERLATIFSEIYQKTVEEIADTINLVSEHIPSRRERRLHIGLFGYSRGIGQKRLPRAIGFTAALYSLGIPPELISLGRGIQQALSEGLEESLSTFCRSLKEDVRQAGFYLNRENLRFLSSDNPAWEMISKDISIAESFFRMELGPVTIEHYLHRNIVSSIYFLLQENKNIAPYLQDAAILRKSLG
ncbi:MAG: phosphoenolpyruvate carboxylase [Leptospirillum sp.]|nr:phosphoenolpyruvate carboxylase [Nitrospiraceae bacterium]